MAKTDFKSIDDYIRSKPEELQTILKQVFRAIRKAVPKAEEGISYQIPAFKLDGAPLLFFAGWKKHFSLYPASDALFAEFKNELDGYKKSKGTIQFPLTEPFPADLIGRIAKFRVRQLQMRETDSRNSGRKPQLERVRRICASMPSMAEKLSHGAPTFFVRKDNGVFTMFADNHHNDGHLAVWLPAPDGLQAALIEDDPKTYFKPPYVGSSGWIGIELNRIRDEALTIHIRKAWEIVARAKKKGN